MIAYIDSLINTKFNSIFITSVFINSVLIRAQKVFSESENRCMIDMIAAGQIICLQHTGGSIQLHCASPFSMEVSYAQRKYK